jgi:leucyl-tRNA synthetase
MSKSKGNIIDPDIQVRKYGSDVIRMYLCFMGPYNQGGPWNIKGIGGVVRFLKRVSGQKSKIRSDESASSNSKENPAFKKLIHQTIKKVKEDIEGFRFNTAISSLMILINAIDKEKEISVINYKILLRLLSPFAPHLTEQLWQEIKPDKLKLKEFKPKDSIHNQPWPEYNPKLITKKQIYLIIQINGRVRDKIEVKVPLNRKIAEELAFSSQKVGKWIKGKKVKRVIFVPGKLINIVI